MKQYSLTTGGGFVDIATTNSACPGSQPSPIYYLLGLVIHCILRRVTWIISLDF
jgi:hypothetical protein